MKLIKNGKILRNGILKDTEILIDGKRIKTISSKINSSSLILKLSMLKEI